MKSDKMVNLFLDILELWQLSNMHHWQSTVALPSLLKTNALDDQSFDIKKVEKKVCEQIDWIW